MRSATVDEQDVLVGGERVRYRVAGDGDAVVLLHGWPTTGALWRRQIPMLARDARVYAPDLPGFGASAPLSPDRCDWNGYVESVIEFLDAVGERHASLVGHDVGASVALLTAIRHPDRIDRLVVLDTTPFPRMPWIVRLLVATAKVPFVGRLLTTRAGFRALFHLGTARPRPEVGELVDLYHGPIANDPTARKNLRDVLTHLDPVELAEVESGLTGLRCPVLVLWGERDVSGPLDVARRLHREIVGSTLHTIAGCGHFAPDDAPEQIGELLADFFKTSTVIGQET